MFKKKQTKEEIINKLEWHNALVYYEKLMEEVNLVKHRIMEIEGKTNFDEALDALRQDVWSHIG
jgi:uncharacterized protein YdcH (DUF465 family)